MPSATDIITRIRADASQFKSEISSAEASTQKLASSDSTMAEVGKAAFIGLGVGMLGVAAISVKFAMDFEQAHTRVKVALEQAGTSMKAQQGNVDALDSTMRKLGFTDTETETGFARLVTATRNVGESTKDMSLAADIARARNIDLVTATDMLVKVEGGRYTALTRTLGVSKDVIASFHSTADAIDYLTGRFGGSAQAATDTLAVKMQILGAQAEHIAVQIGDLLIPVIEQMGSALAATIDFFVQNGAAAIALAVVVGGPLVAAMATFLAGLVATAATSIVDFFVMMAGAAADAAFAVYSAASAFIALGPAMMLATGGILAIGAAIVLLGSTDGVYERNTAAAKQWAQELIAATKGTGDELMHLKSIHENLDAEITTNKAKIDDLTKNYDKYGITVDDANQKARQLAYATDLLQQKDAAIVPEIKKLEEAHRLANLQTKALATTLGVDLPAGMTLTTAQQKIMTATVAEFGPATVTAMQQAGVSIEQMGAVAKDAANFGKTLAGSWDGFVLQIASHDFSQPVKEQAAVSEQSMEQFFVGSALKANEWAGHLQELIDAHVSPTIVNVFAKAGPAADQNLQAVDQMLELHGADWVNTVMASGNQQVAAMQSSYDAMTVALAVNQAERKQLWAATTAAVGTATVAGNEQMLNDLASSTDTHMAAIAKSIIDQMATARANAQQPIAITANADQVGGTIGEIESALGNLTSHPWVVEVQMAGGVHF